MPTLSVRRRLTSVLILVVIAAGVAFVEATQQTPSKPSPQAPSSSQSQLASDVLHSLATKGRAPRTGYSREAFGGDWGIVGGCDTRNLILKRDLQNVQLGDDGCSVNSGTLHDPYTDKVIQFTRGPTTSDDVQIDHVVAVADAWQKGAQQQTAEQRIAFYNDPLNLLAVDGPTNQQKSDSDAATWLPPHKAYRCQYVARQIAVKTKYQLWVTAAERSAMERLFGGCPNQQLPIVEK